MGKVCALDTRVTPLNTDPKVNLMHQNHRNPLIRESYVHDVNRKPCVPNGCSESLIVFFIISVTCRTKAQNGSEPLEPLDLIVIVTGLNCALQTGTRVGIFTYKVGFQFILEEESNFL